MARIFKEGREAWKDRAAAKQKKLRNMEIKIRDLSASRENWKERAQKAEKELKEIQNENKSISRKEDVTDMLEVRRTQQLCSGSLSAPYGHVYPVFVMQIAIMSVLYVLTGFRGSMRNLTMLGQLINIPIPGFNTVRQWIHRIGYYLLEQTPEYRTDWIMITDVTATLGKLKCLLTIGIARSSLEEGLIVLPLKHKDMTVLSLEVFDHLTGAIIEERLNALASRTGTPCQIIADHGSDVKKGISNYQENNPSVIYTYDVTHQMALLLKGALEADEQYQGFVKQCQSSINVIQQTELSFLRPQKQRSQSRWLNIDILIYWAEFILTYQTKGDFSLISRVYRIDVVTYSILHKTLPIHIWNLFKQLSVHDYPNEQSYREAVIDKIGQDSFVCYQSVLLDAASVGKRRFHEKLGWIMAYKDDISIYVEMMELVKQVQYQLKHDGLNAKSLETFEKTSIDNDSLTPLGLALKDKILEYIKKESKPIVNGQILPSSSDIIESLFGKYKMFLKTSPLNEVSKMLLMLPLFVTNITNDLIKRAMESVRYIDVEKWAYELFGLSSLAKRKLAATSNMNIKTA